MMIRGVRVGVPICEDIWKEDVVECLAETGSELLLVPNEFPIGVARRTSGSTSSPAASPKAVCR